ncbi:MAG TPA: hypothetical protein VE861_04855 [Gemmatimonadaceae bacterium]|nr:hypothetical protein [Gemmatimonadaceae bacterium]
MQRKFFAVVGLAALMAGAPQAGAQVSKGYSDVGFVVGLGNIGDANLAFGGRYENIFKRLPDLANGLLGFEVSADVYSFGRGRGNVRYIPVGATFNYHFPLAPSSKVDLFLGAGLGFQSVSCSRFLEDDPCGYNSGLYVIGRAGGRYFLKPNLALYGDLGAGAATLNLGLTFKLN